jgi:hypothetical protein
MPYGTAPVAEDGGGGGGGTFVEHARFLRPTVSSDAIGVTAAAPFSCRAPKGGEIPDAIFQGYRALWHSWHRPAFGAAVKHTALTHSTLFGSIRAAALPRTLSPSLWAPEALASCLRAPSVLIASIATSQEPLQQQWAPQLPQNE